MTQPTTIADGTPQWAPRPRPVPGAPNMVAVVLDDLGWSDIGCFGSEIATHTLDTLAAGGVRLTNFHVTPLCSPTRASLLTGQDHHKVGMRFLAVADSGFANNRGRLPAGIDTVPGLLRDHGYGTYLVGKWHLAPQEELTPAGPYQNWPLARGFERFYGFLGGASDQFAPELYRDNSPVEPSNAPDYHLSADLVDQSIRYLADHVAYRPADPFFLQLAFGATHAPFQVPDDYLDRYSGHYDAGWETVRERRLAKQVALGVAPPGTRLTEPDPDVPRWETLTSDERRLAARGQEVFAAFLEHTDAQLARLVAWLRERDLLDNTLVAVFADNGAAGDGGPLGTSSVIAPYNRRTLPLEHELAQIDSIGGAAHPAHYATGWAMAGNTPFRLYKQFVDLGGVRSPAIVHWPARIADPGALRDQYCHVVDLAVTLLDCGAGPAERGMDGLAVTDMLTDGSAPGPRSTQVYEMVGHRAIWHRGWKATTRHRQGDDYADDTWRLYDTVADFSESTDLAAVYPARLRELQDLWWREAQQHGIFPLDDRSLKELLELNDPHSRPPLDRLVLAPGQSHLGFVTRLTGTHRSMLVEARLRGRATGQDGVLLASGAVYGGYVLYVLGDSLTFEHHFLNDVVTCTASEVVPAGDSTVGFRCGRRPDGSAHVEVLVNDVIRASGDIPVTSMQPAFYGLDVGRDAGSRVSTAYRGEFPFPPEVLRDVTLTFADDPNDLRLLAHHFEVNQ